MPFARFAGPAVSRAASAMFIGLAVVSPCAAQVQSETATVRIAVMVPAVLAIEGATPVAQDTVDGYEVVTTRVVVRGNVPHRLDVRAASTRPSAVRLRAGLWESLDADRGVTAARTDMLGETSHLVVCRTPIGVAADDGTRGCALVFEVGSTDERFPVTSGPFVAVR